MPDESRALCRARGLIDFGARPVRYPATDFSRYFWGRAYGPGVNFTAASENVHGIQVSGTLPYRGKNRPREEVYLS